MGDEIAQLLREFEEAMTDFFAGEQRDATPSTKRGCGFTPIPTSVRFRRENTKHWFREHAQLERRHGGALHAAGAKTQPEEVEKHHRQ